MVVSRGRSQVPFGPNGQRIGPIEAPGFDDTVQVHPCIEGFAVDSTTSHTIGKCIQVCNGAVRIEESQFCRLVKVDRTPVICRASRELVQMGMDRSECGELS